MSDVTQILGQIEEGDGQAAEKLLPVVYDDLRKLLPREWPRRPPGRRSRQRHWCMRRKSACFR